MNDLNTQNKSGLIAHASIIADMPTSQQHAAGHKSLGNLHSNASYGQQHLLSQGGKQTKYQQPLFGGTQQSQALPELMVGYSPADSSHLQPGSHQGSMNLGRTSQKSASSSKKVPSRVAAGGSKASAGSGSSGTKAARQKSSRVGGAASAKYEPAALQGGGSSFAKTSGQASMLGSLA